MASAAPSSPIEAGAKVRRDENSDCSTDPQWCFGQNRCDGTVTDTPRKRWVN
ncbi:hypothetical protein MJO28_015558 [Puccinia striiformis f. sp. tritici]|uniref:Uncharacterized protein n=2 Tax=Puccinia striiformis f. sp. tritici TaxID=168172 RepID=A0A0L0VNZ6_9BASI|nr:hypothetical protein MJO28_015558 [Puccinia striiformis f. sp. tritici]KAI9624286.1 hypothetical protein KEM48_009028 [Puccinia striiformis f. sp. tritici PST-130]KNF00989.1 hypothetical protein PSTG_05883 [Puccinia striiformis f. sp. tritici PST-78]